MPKSMLLNRKRQYSGGSGSGIPRTTTTTTTTTNTTTPATTSSTNTNHGHQPAASSSQTTPNLLPSTSYATFPNSLEALAEVAASIHQNNQSMPQIQTPTSALEHTPQPPTLDLTTFLNTLGHLSNNTEVNNFRIIQMLLSIYSVNSQQPPCETTHLDTSSHVNNQLMTVKPSLLSSLLPQVVGKLVHHKDTSNTNSTCSTSSSPVSSTVSTLNNIRTPTTLVHANKKQLIAPILQTKQSKTKLTTKKSNKKSNLSNCATSSSDNQTKGNNEQEQYHKLVASPNTAQTLLSPSAKSTKTTNITLKKSNLNEKQKKKYVCDTCSNGYASRSNLLRHQQIHNDPEDSSNIFKCPKCDMVYLSKASYNMHLATHDPDHKCNKCHKEFSRKWLLKGHFRTHTHEKPFVCHVCEKEFADRSNLRAHIQTHSGKKPWVCNQADCNKKFALKSYLSKHLVQTHKIKSKNKNTKKVSKNNNKEQPLVDEQ